MTTNTFINFLWCIASYCIQTNFNQMINRKQINKCTESLINLNLLITIISFNFYYIKAVKLDKNFTKTWWEKNTHTHIFSSFRHLINEPCTRTGSFECFSSTNSSTNYDSRSEWRWKKEKNHLGWLLYWRVIWYCNNSTLIIGPHLFSSHPSCTLLKRLIWKQRSLSYEIFLFSVWSS